jgi:hypothetical protein
MISIGFSFHILMVLFHLRQNSILLVAELDPCRVNPSDAVLKLDNAIDLPDLTSGMATPQRTRVYYIGPLFPNMKLAQLIANLTEPGLPSDLTI